VEFPTPNHAPALAGVPKRSEPYAVAMHTAMAADSYGSEILGLSGGKCSRRPATKRRVVALSDYGDEVSMKALFAMAVFVSTSAFAQWRYSEIDDPMTSAKGHMALAQSDNTLALGFPYQGQNNGHIMVRQAPRSGLNVMFGVDKGQFACGIDDCSLLIRFDDTPPVRYHAVPPASHDSNKLFLSRESDFVARARKAKSIRIEATMYQSGSQILVFSPGPLIWDSTSKNATTAARPSPAQQPQVPPGLTMMDCNARANAQDLKGDARKAMMKACLMGS
jgi:hypothetical protein